MAGYECETCSAARPVTRLIVDLITGSTQAVCDEDLGITLIGELATWLAVDPQRLYDTVQRFAAREAKSAAAQASQPADPTPAGEPSQDQPPAPQPPAGQTYGNAAKQSDESLTSTATAVTE